MAQLFEELEWRGLVHQVTDPGLVAKLDQGGMVAYIGFDPTADSLHVGNLLQLFNLRRLQDHGHKPIVLAGGSTGMIGDPGGRSTERNLLGAETLAGNVAAIEPQLQKFLDFGPGPNGASLVNNFDWTKDVNIIDFLREIGKHFSVNQMIAKDAVRTRLDSREQGISYTEFSYSLLQAYDYQHLFDEFGCTLQLGGSDQWGNITSGVDLIRRSREETVFGFCSPLVTKADGTKFGKSASGAVWLDPEKTSPYAFYQFFLRSEDSKVVDYLKYFTFLSQEEIGSLDESNTDNPHERRAHQSLAAEITRRVHGETELQRVIYASKALFSGDIHSLDEPMLLSVLEEVPSHTTSRSRIGELLVAEALTELGLSPSRSAARSAIQQGGVTLNGKKVVSVDDSVAALVHDRYAVLRRGKRDYGLLRFE